MEQSAEIQELKAKCNQYQQEASALYRLLVPDSAIDTSRGPDETPTAPDLDALVAGRELMSTKTELLERELTATKAELLESRARTGTLSKLLKRVREQIEFEFKRELKREQIKRELKRELKRKNIKRELKREQLKRVSSLRKPISLLENKQCELENKITERTGTLKILQGKLDNAYAYEDAIGEIHLLEYMVEMSQQPVKELQEAKAEIIFLKEQVEIYEVATDIDTHNPQQETRAQACKNTMTLEVCDRAAMKRRVVEDFYDSTRKRMKPSQDINLTLLQRPEFESICQLLEIATSEVLQVAKDGGLINPLHFGVGRHGILALTDDGLNKAELFSKFKSQSEMISDWTEKKTLEMSTRVRDHLDESGFLEHGHSSLLDLVDWLENEEQTEPNEISDRLNEVVKEVTLPFQQLSFLIGRIWEDPRLEVPGSCLADVREVLAKLDSKHEDGELSNAAEFVLNMSPHEIPGEAHSRLAAYLNRIWSRYRSLESLAAQCKTDSCIPPHYLQPPASL
ncbi:hypothetical protein AK830_g12642 [Neonectria ditissima]|uniref:Uncharacterized protein n=1 Tax=Neonectria ditissima TaxID=78410 RepID=A0A0P7B024_9HYPO|nr:hypothetical protein AK830_g12642 [Neonectria ditissima]